MDATLDSVGKTRADIDVTDGDVRALVEKLLAWAPASTGSKRCSATRSPPRSNEWGRG
jgi:hypothetical protein